MQNYFSLTHSQSKPYIQYQKNRGINEFFSIFNDEINSSYLSEFDFFKHINIKESVSEFLEFYAKNYLNITRPIASGLDIKGSTIYDLETLYDKDFIYDNKVFVKPTIELEDYLKYLSFVYDYSNDTITLEAILKFIYEWDSSLNYGDIKIVFEADLITIKMPQNHMRISNLYTIILVNRQTMGLPPESCLRFELYNKGA